MARRPARRLLQRRNVHESGAPFGDGGDPPPKDAKPEESISEKPPHTTADPTEPSATEDPAVEGSNPDDPSPPSDAPTEPAGAEAPKPRVDVNGILCSVGVTNCK